MVRAKSQKLQPRSIRKANEELERANEALRVELEFREHAEAQMRLQLAALECAANGIVMTDRTGAIVWVNPAFTRLTGYARDEVIGKNPRVLKSGEHADAYYRTLWETILAGQVWHGEVMNRRKDGTLYVEEMTITPVRPSGGEITHFIAVKQDVTERKRAEQAIAQSEERYRSLFENLLDGYAYCQMLLDAQGHPQDFVYLDVNAAFATLTGLKDVVGKRVTDVIPGIREQHPELFETYARVAATGRPEKMLLDFKPLALWLSLSVYSPARGYFVAVFENITERVQAEQSLQEALGRIQKLNQALEQRAVDLERTNAELRVANEKQNVANERLQSAVHRIEKLNQDLERRADDLTAANSELEAFSYSVSHDLRTPLSGVAGLAQLLLAEYSAQLDPIGQDYARLVLANAQHATELIQGLLAFSRFSRQPLNRRVIEPAHLVQRALQTLCPDRENRKIEMTIGPLPACEGDPLLLEQVWVNLIGNALKYTRKRPVAKIEIGSQTPTEGGDPVYVIRDNGVGFDMAGADHLFGVFQRMHDSEEYEGTGVGLAIVQRILHRHGGRIWAEAAVDQGATFYFTVGRSNPE